MSSLWLDTISNYFGIYVGLPIFIFGIIGNLMNLCILFSTRSNSCSFLLFVSSLFNLIVLPVGLLPKILSIGFNIDGSLSVLKWCKARVFIAYIAMLTSITCICFASTDRFFVSCRSVTWRNRSKLSTAKISIFIAILIIIIINVPYIIFYKINEVETKIDNITTTCSSINFELIVYGNYFVRPILLCILPCTILSLTGWLTYRNFNSITNIHQRGTFQRGLTSMISLQIITIIISTTPFATINIYQSITSSTLKTSYRLAQEMLLFDLTNIILYINFASNFYVYIISSTSYRRDFFQHILFCYRQNHFDNRIGTVATEQFQINRTSIIKQLPLIIH